MKLDTKVLRHLTHEDWKVLSAVEQGSKSHELVPTSQIVHLSHLRSPSAVHKSISLLAKSKLIARVQNAAYDGYRLTYGGLDYLALHAHTKADTVYAVGNQVGIGKESDIFAVAGATGTQYVLKIHRLGRISFRRVRNTRDYLRKRGGARPKGGGSMWMHMSRLAALKEYTFMAALRAAGFPVPKPIACNRHTIVMELIDAFPLRKIAQVPDPPGLYAELMALIVRLAGVGLIHADFNEFNILIREDQMVSTSHANARMYFDRDVGCIKQFFERRFSFVSDATGPTFEEATAKITTRMDVAVEASGFSKKMAKELEKYMEEVGVDGDRSNGDDEAENDDDESDESNKVSRDEPYGEGPAAAVGRSWRDSAVETHSDQPIPNIESVPTTAGHGDTVSLLRSDLEHLRVDSKGRD